jgi:hypothetical protein
MQKKNIILLKFLKSMKIFYQQIKLSRREICAVNFLHPSKNRHPLLIKSQAQP